jgi:hypothetical protein
MSFGNTTENAILLLIYNATTWANYAVNATSSPEANIAAALHTGDPGEAGTMSTSEAAYTSYARASIARTSGGFTVTNDTVNPAATISFATGTGGSGTGSHFSFGKTGGGAAAILNYGTVTPNITFGNGVQPQLTTATAITLN